MPITISSVRVGDFVFNHLIHQNPTDSRNNFVKHVHNHFEIILFLSGDATYIIEDRKYKLKPFDLVLIPPSRYHYIQIDSDADYDRFDLLFPSEQIGEELIGKLPSGTDVVSCTDHRFIRDVFARLDRYSELGTDAITDLLPGLIKEIFYNLSDNIHETVSKPENMSPLISRALDYINNYLFTIKDIKEVSTALFIAPTYFFKVFKEQMKISPKKYITVKRLMAAEKRIRDGEKPSDVFADCGFSTYTAFYKRYVDYFGTPPSKTM
jgi:AraC-like DNA-binding protein